MHLLLDTHVFVWWDQGDGRLAHETKQIIASADNRVMVSAASVWEIAIKRQIGKFTYPRRAVDAIVANGFEHLAVTAYHAEAAGALPMHHADPFDRMLIAQAKIEGLVLVTSDQHIARYGVPTLPA